jgi:hypothetical protein
VGALSRRSDREVLVLERPELKIGSGLLGEGGIAFRTAASDMWWWMIIPSLRWQRPDHDVDHDRSHRPISAYWSVSPSLCSMSKNDKEVAMDWLETPRPTARQVVDRFRYELWGW